MMYVILYELHYIKFYSHISTAQVVVVALFSGKLFSYALHFCQIERESDSESESNGNFFAKLMCSAFEYKSS